MKKEKKYILITDSDFTLIGDFYRNLERQGPGSTDIAKTALQFIPGIDENSVIADIGCGTGGQTMTLASLLKGKITAMDLMPQFVEELKSKIREKDLRERVTAVLGSMDTLPFGENSIDLMWAEGSIYNIGFKNGLEEWRRYLKPGGFVAVSEASWFTKERPAEIQEFWDENYAEIATVADKIAVIQEAGYMPVAHFALPESSWWEYFLPIEENYGRFLENQGNSEEARLLVRHFREEFELYKKYSKYYGYVFYIAQKI